jgi:predicted dehydrogenase
MMALENGFNVVIDKPITFTLEEAKKLKAKIEETKLTLALTHTYSGYPAVKEARERVRRGDFGKIRKVFVEYPQGWLSSKLEDTGNPQAIWPNMLPDLKRSKFVQNSMFLYRVVCSTMTEPLFSGSTMEPKEY